MPGLAGANDGTFVDRVGGRGPLAIEKVEYGHAHGYPVFTITFDRPLDLSSWTRDDYFVVAFDWKGTTRADGLLYFLKYRGRLTNLTYFPRMKATGSGADFRRTGPRTIVTEAPLAAQHYPGFAFAAGSWFEGGAVCPKGCWDAAPERGWILHDFTGPRVTRFRVPERATATEGRLAIPVSWHVHDTGRSGLDEHALLWRPAGATDWIPAARTRDNGAASFELPAEEGGHVEVMVRASDRAGNVTETPVRQVTVPFDQASGSGNAAFTGAWAETTREGAYFGTIHVSNTPHDELVFSGTGTEYCIAYSTGAGFTDGTMSVGDQSQFLSMSGQGVECMTFESAIPRVVRVKPGPGRINTETGYHPDVINVDAYWVR